MNLIQIVPALPPTINGLGDYALNLARQLRQDFKVDTHFIVGDPTWTSSNEIEGFPIYQLPKRSKNSIPDTLNNKIQCPPKILLHYVGYGYAKRGCPNWLVDGLAEWKAQQPNTRLITMFHEVYASGPPWTSAFWLSALQKSLATRLARVSDRTITTNQFMAGILTQLGNSKLSVFKIPVFSNIGEASTSLPLTSRSRRLVVFGHRNGRTQVYQQCRDALIHVCRMLEIKEICDIGVSTGLNLQSIAGIPVVEMGVLEAPLISKLLSDSVAGFLNFPPPTFLAKSTIFASFCAHGLIPCMVASSAEPVDDLVGSKHYWSSQHSDQPLSIELGQAIANNAHAWYQTHRLAVQAEFFAHQLTALSTKHHD